MAERVVFQWTDVNGAVVSAFVDVTSGDRRKPIVVLLHGTSGRIWDMSNPGVFPGANYDYQMPVPSARDHGWRSYPGVGFWSFELDPYKQVRSWQTFLGERLYRTVNYEQVDNRGLLSRPVRQLTGLMRALVQRFPDTKFVLLGQSRGGLLARKFLADNRSDTALRSAVAQVITLHSPNHGTELANIATALNGAVNAMLAPHPPPVRSVLRRGLGFFLDEIGAPAYEEMKVGSAFLADLARREPVPDVEYHTFGGTSPLLTRFRAWAFTAGSAVARWHWPPYRWQTVRVDFGLSPLLNSLPDFAPEIVPGQGDMLVTNARAHLPFAVTRTTNPMNHAEALWLPEIQAQVEGVLARVPPAPALLRDALFVGQSVPSEMVLGSSHVVEVRMRNMGNQTWTAAAEYRLGSHLAQWRWPRVDVPAPVAPGQEARFQFVVTAPTTSGSYTFQWRMLQEGVEWFGEMTPAVTIRVGVRVPDVRELSQAMAGSMLRDAGFVPRFLPSTGVSSPWVYTQSPAGGQLRSPGETVTCEVRSGSPL